MTSPATTCCPAVTGTSFCKLLYAESQMGPHLHFSVSRDGAVIDPRDYVGSEE